MDYLAAFSETVESVFGDIAETRMDGVPILNSALGVAMRGMRRFDAYHAGVLVTPWFMNLMLFPMEKPATPMRVGYKRNVALPSGMYEAVWSHEDALGGYWSISLFSPMFEFDAMEIAVDTADASMELLFSPPGEDDTPDFSEAMVQPGAGRDVEQRLAQAEEEAEAAKEAAAPGEEADKKPAQLDRRALFGIGRKQDEGEAV